MSSATRALIVGTGIGGATAAIALRRAGVEVHAIDVKAETPKTGTGICLLHNAIRALASIGVAEDCQRRGFAFGTVRHFDHAGRALGANPAPPACGMRRPDLADILESHAQQAGAELEKGVSIEALVDRGERVDVTFKDGRQSSYDLVIAADGAYSGLRRQVFGADCAPRFAGQSVWRFSAARPPEVDGFCLFRTPEGRTVGALPTSNDSCYFFFLENTAEPMRVPEDQLDALLKARLACFSAPVIQAALEQVTGPADVLFRPLDITLVPAPWHRGRVVLLGDAAHAPTPHMTSGGGMAIEDAVVLAECLAAAAVPTALERYSARRFDRVKTVFDASYQLSQYEQDPVSHQDKAVALLLQTYQFLGQPC